MNGQQLKKSILQLAIQGRLVPQNLKDEPASVLLARIREEKQRLVDEKIIKKSKPLSHITDDEKPFDIPESWKWVRLGEIGDWGAGATPSKGNMDYYIKGTIPWLRTGDLNNSIVKDVEMRITEKALSECSLRLCNIGDVLIAMYGATIGKVAIAGINLTTNQACCACTPLCLYNKYLFYFLQANKDDFIKMGAGGAQPNISREKIIYTLFPLPPLAEQHRIVEKIEELLPLVEEYDEAQKKLDKLNDELPEKLKKSVLQQAIMGRLGTQNDKDEPASALLARIREEKKKLMEEKKNKKDKSLAPIKDEEKPFGIPESWEWVRLGEISHEISDGTHKTPKYVENGIPFLSVQNISSGKLNINKIKYISEDEHIKLIKRVKPQKNDILICRIGTLGRAIKVNWDYEFSIFVSLGLIRLIDTSICNYLVACLNSPLGYSWIDKVKVGGGTHTYKINLSDLPNFIIPLPPLAEQHRIVDKLDKIFEKIESMKK